MNKNLERLSDIWQTSWILADRRKPWRWLEDSITAIPYSPVPGRFQSDYSPWIKEPLEELANDKTNLISIIAAIQSGKTTVIELGACWAIANSPAPMLWLDQTDPDAKDQCQNRLQPLFKNCPPVAQVLPPAHRRKNDGWTFYNGMPLWVKGGHNKTNLQRRSIRWLFVDESWRLPPGHMAEAEARVTAFGWLGKRVFTSQFGELEDDTHLKFNETDQRRWHVCCTECGALQPYTWENVAWDEGAKDENGKWDFQAVQKSTTYSCGFCKHAFRDTQQNRKKLSMDGPRTVLPHLQSKCDITGETIFQFVDPSKGARFIAENPTADSSKVGFHWNGLAATSWGSLVEMFLRAKEEARRGDMENLKVFFQKRLAEPFDNFTDDFTMEIESSGYEPHDVWEDEGGFHRTGKIELRVELEEQQETAQRAEEERALKEDRPSRKVNVYKGALRMASIDVQKGYFYLLIRSWSPEGSSRLLHWQKVGTYDEIKRICDDWGVLPRLTLVDAGYDAYGKKAKDGVGVYAACSRFGWTALMGEGRKQNFRHTVPIRENGRVVRKPIDRFYSPVTKVSIDGNRTARRIYWSNLNVKDVLNAVRSNQDPDQGATWDVYDGVDEEYLRQMESEIRIFEKGQWRWVPVGSHSNNHLWDCEAMQIVGALMLKIIGKESVGEE